MKTKFAVLALVLFFAGGGLGYFAAQKNSSEHAGTANSAANGVASSSAQQSNTERKVLYWYDPMSPAAHFDKPGKSPFMDMDLVPRYAGEDDSIGVRIDPVQVQNLAVRTEKVVRSALLFNGEIPANIEFNNYRQARVQARAEGFVEKSYPLSVGDTITQGTAIADLTLPGFAADQSEYLLLRQQNAAAELIGGLREKMRLAGMPEEMLAALDKSGKVQTRLTIRAPVSGILTGLEVYKGMNVSKEMTLATIQGADPIWVMANVAESDLHLARSPGRIRLSVSAYPEHVFQVTSAILLPKTDENTRTTPLRLTVNNTDGLLKPGMSAQVRLREKGAEALLIPTQSLIEVGDEKRVIVRAKDGSFVPRLVQVLRSSREQTAIASGVEEGEEVVSSGLFLLDSEANLQGALERMRKLATDGTQSEQGDAATPTEATTAKAAVSAPVANQHTTH